MEEHRNPLAEMKPLHFFSIVGALEGETCPSCLSAAYILPYLPDIAIWPYSASSPEERCWSTQEGG